MFACGKLVRHPTRSSPHSRGGRWSAPSVLAPGATASTYLFGLAVIRFGLLACPLMTVFMMGPLHRMPAANDAAPRKGDPCAPEALTQRLAELEAERVAIADLLAASGTEPSADRASEVAARVTTAAHAKRA